ncbi:hypothetical protein STRCI_004708 [Streptomyces cinnabarinus]|uniref:Uncharacterized protein n=1 Tax=Streptomyces cinnabarinus TaxID=67287 RepID=A0ABY7KFQ2_9ACTN|nr:hypothetical protein [Streptomyces cinnabarinus]WAZ23369.1 hypothetical protein STRCI_004708 [Streptomyces cinnabarinus]
MIFFETEADPTHWFPLPLHWTARDQEEMVKWSLMCAEIVRHRHRKWWYRPRRIRIAERFLRLAEAHPVPNVPADQAFLYAGDARRVPQPFYALAAGPEGEDREAGLRTMVQADEENPVRPPDVVEFRSDRLGRGLRCIRYFGSGSGSERDLNASLNYGWWSEEHRVYVSVRTVSTDVPWLMANLAAFDDFARSVWLNPNPE